MPYSIVIVTWECAGYLAGLVETMNAHLDGTQELIVVDNGSSEDPGAAFERWKGPGELIRLGENRGFGAGTNVGVERARHEAVVMLNPDTELVDASLDRLAGAALELGALVGPRVLNPDRTIQPSAAGPNVGFWPWARAILPGAVTPSPIRRWTEPYRLTRTVRVTWLTGSCIAGPLARLVELGPFDPALHMYGEDVDLGLRAAASGVPSYFCPDRCRIIHHGAGSSTQVFGSRDAWMPEGARNWRAAVRRTHGERSERWAWRAFKLNLGVRLAAKRFLGRATPRDRAAYLALARAREVPELAPISSPLRVPVAGPSPGQPPEP